MAKIVIDDSEQVDPASLKVLERLAQFFDRLDAPYQMPKAMADWLHDYNSEHQVDTFYQTTIGFTYKALSLRFTFKQEMIIMEFMAPDGMRLTEIRLHT